MDETVYERLMGGDTIDSILNSGKINRIGRLREREFINYSAVELKLSLLLGLRMHYINYIIARYVPQASMVVRTALRQALWFIEKRRGLVMIEMALLLNCFGFQMYLTANTQPETYYQVSGELDYQNAFAIQQALTTANQAALDGYVTSYLDVNGSRYTFARLNEAAGQGSNYTAIDGTTYSLFMDVAPADQKIKRDKPYALELFLPAFMQGFRERSFTDRFHMLMDSSLPVNLDYNYHYVSDEYLPELISSYTLWHESLRYKDNEKEQREDLEKYSDPVKVKELEQERRKQQREQLMLNAKALVATLQKIYN
jgi:hypothetical protein